MEIEAKTSPSEVRRILKNVPGIEMIETQAAGNEVTRGSIREKKGEDIREDVFRAFASAGSPLLTLKVSGTTLEDVFMELTQKDTVPAAFAKKSRWEEDQEGLIAGEGADQDAGDL